MLEHTVSVVIPAFNATATLRETVDSAVNQDLPPLEILIVDDASLDGTAELAEELAREHGTVRVLRNAANVGLSETRNVGIRAANGAWIALLDSDDVWVPSKLRKQMDFAFQNPSLDLVGCFFWEQFDSRRGAVRREFYWPSACVVRATALKKLEFAKDWRSSEFPEFISRFDEAHTRAGVSEPLMAYRVTTTGIAHQSFMRERISWLAARENTRRRKKGMPSLAFDEVEGWYASSRTRRHRLSDWRRWRADYSLRTALIAGANRRWIRAVQFATIGAVLNPVAFVKKAGRSRSMI